MAYVRKANRLLSDAVQARIVDDLLVSADSHPIIQGAGGVRKMRARVTGQGKRGGLRVCYFYRSHIGTVYLLTLYGKDVKEDLTAADKRILKALVKRIDDVETVVIRT